MQRATCNAVEDFTAEEQLLLVILIGCPLKEQSAIETAAAFVPFPLFHRVHCYLSLLESE